MPAHNDHSRINRIAFINLEGQLETIAPDGSERRALSDTNRFFQFPAWSPNGDAIGVIGGSRNGAAVYAFRDAAGGPAAGQMLYNQTGQVPIYLNWSPDSRNLSFIAIVPPQQSFGLHVVALDQAGLESAHTHHTLAVGRPCFWDWSPAGDQILLHLGFAGEQNSRLAFVDPFKPQSIRTSDDIAQPGLFQSPAISRTGNYWAFASMNAKGSSELVIDGRSIYERITLAHFGLVALGWNPVRDQLAFISPPGPARTAYGPLTVVNVDGSHVTLTDDMVLAFFWSPNGRHIAYFTLANTYQQLSHALGLGMPMLEHMQAKYPGGLIKEPAESDARDGERDHKLYLNLWVADVDTSEQHLLYTFQPLEIFTNQFLPFFDQYALSHRIWSPDGDAIVLPVLEKEEAKVMVIPSIAPRRRPAHIADGLMAFWSRQ